MKIKEIIDSAWFNAIMSVVAVLVLVTNVLSKKYVYVVIWLVLAYHFIKLTYNKREMLFK
jgi:hypothetical protein